MLSEVGKLGPVNKNISIFYNVCIEILGKYAPEKQKYIRANQVSFMDSKLNHAIMLRSKLRKKFWKVDLSETEILTRKNKIYALAC